MHRDKKRSSGQRRHFSSKRGRPQKGPKKESIPVEKFIKKAKPQEVEAYEAEHAFSDFRLVKSLQKSIARKGFRTPSMIQDQAIPLALAGRDVVGIADTGTGKTAAFAIPLINRLLRDYRAHALVLAPTRELATQIAEEVASLTGDSGLVTTVLIGGVPMPRQIKKLKKTSHIIIGTPGRIKDHLQRGSLDLSDIQMVVLDEVDRMLDMGFVHDITSILAKVPEERQSLFFSATIDARVEGIIRAFAHDVETVRVKQADTSDNVEQSIIRYATKEEKIEKLHDNLVAWREGKVIIFDETKRNVNKVSEELNKRGFHSVAIHGNKSQSQRQRALDTFKSGKASIMVATDVAARGIDVPEITHVVNFSTPQSYADYTHRIGRAGRAGKMGQAVTFVSPEDEERGRARQRRRPQRRR